MTAIVIRDEQARVKAHKLVGLSPIGYEIVSREHKAARNNEQNNYYWAMMQEIAEQAAVRGVKFGKDTWHHHYAKLFLPMVEVALPYGGSELVRQSTTKLNIKEFSEYTTQVQADAAQELGVRFSAVGERMSHDKI